ncbi:50S ribosomal protein L20 [Candidatus Nomurabacteria bacterium RIFOXYC2_FULL_36_8]|nr:MAG: 50S ribosomal protein L20 [Candidatus Nomurabacteria bacterium GW2011_GWF2_36_126]KKP96278.1 MAG: 50S ribosomal protein L20 [Candidatus Nomurabacteria bacterium GW2011_GWD2_36_14]KKQ04852.1 MAG: 50S ribosomal protein L20 [Candidatus Nomurabacteria bacterium GW2011_GWF1_36_47]KKQ08323.1 MAG: 50S ribosomal protein L20 [Candidatus Nomurabacteria bacterium GW2011_GWB1_36_6]KKQ12284.1 MAG: 50S ribosomal protein L20 [Candidatus Nomurabacteria bacterium GW2011_GWE1_36_71]KKQ19119.1 MAG: 50S r
MTRVKRGVLKNKTRKNILKQTKGFRFGRGTKKIEAENALMHAGAYSFAHRRDKKADARSLWTTRINAAVRPFELSYSKFVDKLKKKNIEIDRKILSDLAQNNPETFARIVKSI